MPAESRVTTASTASPRWTRAKARTCAASGPSTADRQVVALGEQRRAAPPGAPGRGTAPPASPGHRCQCSSSSAGGSSASSAARRAAQSTGRRLSGSTRLKSQNSRALVEVRHARRGAAQHAPGPARSPRPAGAMRAAKAATSAPQMARPVGRHHGEEEVAAGRLVFRVRHRPFGAPLGLAQRLLLPGRDAFEEGVDARPRRPTSRPSGQAPTRVW